MLLSGKSAVIYGAAGNIGSAVARAFATEGAKLFLTGRTLAKVQRVAEEINSAGGQAEAAEVDALDQQAVEAHMDEVMRKSGRIDVSFNALSIRGDLQGRPLLTLSTEDFMTPILVGTKTHFLTAIAAARHMVKQGSGVVLTLTTPAAGLSGRDHVFHRTGGFSAACAGIESFSRTLAGEVGPKGVRVICLRANAMPESWPKDLPPEALEVIEQLAQGTALGRLPVLKELANAAVFAASDRAGAMTGTILNLTCGSIMDSN
jgi:NAD(P)-dependent dehydrogenase (short-subunit alcohol dehydrogenase family)